MLKESGFFNSLQMKDLEHLSTCSYLKRYNKGQHVYLEGDGIESIYIVMKGSVKLEGIVSDGKKIIKELAYKNDMFGENIFIKDGKRREFAETLCDSMLLIIPSKEIKQLAINNFAFANDITLNLIRKVNILEKRIASFTEVNAKNRILGFFTHLAKAKAKMDTTLGMVLDHKLSHIEIAQITDTSRQTVARVMAELKKEGLILFPNRRPQKLVVDKLLSL